MPKPSPRRDGREAAIQFLFSFETSGEPVEEIDLQLKVAEFWELRVANDKAKDFAGNIISGTVQHVELIDRLISERLENFKFDRLTPVDRNILRVGVFEICYADYIPRPAAINEAIEIAKRFGTEESAKFVNGILDRVKEGDLEAI